MPYRECPASLTPVDVAGEFVFCPHCGAVICVNQGHGKRIPVHSIRPLPKDPWLGLLFEVRDFNVARAHVQKFADAMKSAAETLRRHRLMPETRRA